MKNMLGIAALIMAGLNGVNAAEAGLNAQEARIVVLTDEIVGSLNQITPAADEPLPQHDNAMETRCCITSIVRGIIPQAMGIYPEGGDELAGIFEETPDKENFGDALFELIKHGQCADYVGAEAMSDESAFANVRKFVGELAEAIQPLRDQALAVVAQAEAIPAAHE